MTNFEQKNEEQKRVERGCAISLIVIILVIIGIIIFVFKGDRGKVIAFLEKTTSSIFNEAEEKIEEMAPIKKIVNKKCDKIASKEKIPYFFEGIVKDKFDSIGHGDGRGFYTSYKSMVFSIEINKVLKGDIPDKTIYLSITEGYTYYDDPKKTEVPIKNAYFNANELNNLINDGKTHIFGLLSYEKEEPVNKEGKKIIRMDKIRYPTGNFDGCLVGWERRGIEK